MAKERSKASRPANQQMITVNKRNKDITDKKSDSKTVVFLTVEAASD